MHAVLRLDSSANEPNSSRWLLTPVKWSLSVSLANPAKDPPPHPREILSVLRGSKRPSNSPNQLCNKLSPGPTLRGRQWSQMVNDEATLKRRTSPLIWAVKTSIGLPIVGYIQLPSAAFWQGKQSPNAIPSWTQLDVVLYATGSAGHIRHAAPSVQHTPRHATTATTYSQTGHTGLSASRQATVASRDYQWMTVGDLVSSVL
jgi:hypothetical protein